MDNTILALRREPSAQPRRTVAQVIDWFLANDARMTNPDARRERARVLGLFAANYGERPVDEMIGADLVEFLNAQAGVRTRWTRKRWIGTVKRPFNLAARLGIISGCPFSGVSIGKGKRGRDLSPSEFQSAMRNATPVFRRVLIFLRFSGARPGEMRTLEWVHIRDLARAIVRSEHKTESTLDDPRPRQIQLNAVLIKLLAWLKRKRFHTRWVFTNTFGRQWTTRRLCANLAKIRGKTGLAFDVKLYGCRHAYATGAIVNGVDIATLAELMGHASVKTTEWYLHLAGKSEYLQAASEKAVKGCCRRG